MKKHQRVGLLCLLLILTGTYTTDLPVWLVAIGLGSSSFLFVLD
jgi:hypothetical protein